MKALDLFLMRVRPIVLSGAVFSLGVIGGQPGFAGEEFSDTRLADLVRVPISVGITGQQSVQRFRITISQFDRGDARKKELLLTPDGERVALRRGAISWNEWEGDKGKLTAVRARDEQFHEISLSPNKKMIAASLGERRKSMSIVVIDLTSGRVLQRHAMLEGRVVADMSWSPDSSAIVVLEKASRTGISPFNVFSLIGGHPVPYDDFFVGVYIWSADAWIGYDKAIATDVKYGAGYVSWSQSVENSPK